MQSAGLSEEHTEWQVGMKETLKAGEKNKRERESGERERVNVSQQEGCMQKEFIWPQQRSSTDTQLLHGTDTKYPLAESIRNNCFSFSCFLQPRKGKISKRRPPRR